MIRKYDLPDKITLPCGATLMPVIGGHLSQRPFLTREHSGVDVTKNGWGDALANMDPDLERAERKLIIAEAKRRRLKYRLVSVLSRNLRGKLDLHGRPYRGSQWVFVEVKPFTHAFASMDPDGKAYLKPFDNESNAEAEHSLARGIGGPKRIGILPIHNNDLDEAKHRLQTHWQPTSVTVVY